MKPEKAAENLAAALSAAKPGGEGWHEAREALSAFKKHVSGADIAKFADYLCPIFDDALDRLRE